MMLAPVLLLLSSSALVVPTIALAHQAVPAGPPEVESDEGEDGSEILVTGEKLRGSVVGNIPPENTLGGRDIRATGATSIGELLTALAPQIVSGRGSSQQPLIILSGQRIADFQEISDLPPEAIERIDILPPEVALKYGYSAAQRVVNIVLRRRFHSTIARLGAGIATGGGYEAGESEVSRLMLGGKGRTQMTIHAEGNTALRENQRTLIGSHAALRGSLTTNRTAFGDGSATLNAAASHMTDKSRFGVLVRTTTADNAHIGLSLTGASGSYRWSTIASADHVNAITTSDSGPNILPRDRSRTRQITAGFDALLNGPLIMLPAGRADFTLKLRADRIALDSASLRGGIARSANLKRTTEAVALNLDLPIAERGGALGFLGDLTLNANLAVENLSDFGTLTTLGGGANWSPVARLNLIASYIHEQAAPPLDSLGNPVLVTPGTPVFDYVLGRAVLVSATTGGNAALLGDRRSIWAMSGNWQPLAKLDLRLRGEFVASRATNLVQSFPGPSAALEAAFPDRFTRDPLGNLTAIDLRPTNYDSARSDVLRVGFDFTQPLRSPPPSRETIEQLTALIAQSAGDQSTGTSDSRSVGNQGGRAPGLAGSGSAAARSFDAYRRGRLTFSLTDTIVLVDKAQVRPGLSAIDFLRGDAATGGVGGGRPRHTIAAQAGYFNEGFGARFSASYRTVTRVTGGASASLEFAPLATFDLRLFYSPGENIGRSLKHPWLRGTSIRLEVSNIFDSKQRVRDQFGAVPLSYHADLIDPIGRSVGITIRKLLVPARLFQRPRPN